MAINLPLNPSGGNGVKSQDWPFTVARTSTAMTLISAGAAPTRPFLGFPVTGLEPIEGWGAEAWPFALRLQCRASGCAV